VKYQKQNNADDQPAKERLIKAGVTLFAEKGYASTSVREIVARAGVTKPVLYYYFRNKEGLFRAIMDQATEMQKTLLGRVLETPGSVLERIIDLCGLVYKGMLENQDLFRLIHNLISGTPQGVPEYEFDQYHRRMVDATKAIYVEGLALNEVKEADPEEVAILVLSLVHYSFHMYYFHPEKVDVDQPKRLLRLAFQGLARKGKT
jgi:TetR/AcrR family transcriptional regulator